MKRHRFCMHCVPYISVFPGGKQNSNLLHCFGFRFSVALKIVFEFVFSHGIWKTNLKSVFFFSAKGIETDSLCFGGNIIETNMAALEDVLDEDFVRRFLIEQKQTKSSVVTEIRTQYLNLEGCSLRSV